MSEREIFYIGTFSGAFYTIALNAAREELEFINATDTARCPGFFAIDDSRNALYAGIENSEGRGGVCAFDISDRTNPRIINFVQSHTEGPCYIALIKGENKVYLVGAGYFDGRVQVYPIKYDAGIGDMCADRAHQGSGPYHHPNYISRQNQARMHCVVPVPETDFFACADLGGDCIYVYRIAEGDLELVSRKKLRPGSGPRHIAMTPTGDTWYLVDELDCVVSTLSFDRVTGNLDVRQRISALPDSYTGDSWCSAIHLSSDGRFVYVGNRGYDSIAVFSVGEKEKLLSAVGWFGENVSAPREFCFDRTAEYMLIGGMETDCVTLNRADQVTGSLKYVNMLTGITKPACIISGGTIER